VIVRNSYVTGISIAPPEADPVLIVNPDAVLALAVAFQGFELVARDCGQIP
jgi:hypothetical protein